MSAPMVNETTMSNSARTWSRTWPRHFVDVALWPLLQSSLQNRSIYKVLRKVRNQYAKVFQALQCTNSTKLCRTSKLLLGPFGTFQLLLRNYRHWWGHLVHCHTSKAPFMSATPKTNDASLTWPRLNSFTVQTISFATARSASFQKVVMMTSDSLLQRRFGWRHLLGAKWLCATWSWVLCLQA